MKRLVLIVILGTVYSSAIFAQDYSFKNYKAENGLSHNTVLCSLQDERGFVWFGTKDGLNRFDGYTFKHFRKDSQQANSLGSNFIECISEYNNLILVGTDNGLYIYDESKETFQLVKQSLNLPILDIESDNDGNIWFIGGSTLFKYNNKTLQSESYSDGTSRITEIAKSPNGDIWAAFQNVLFKYIKDTNSFVHHEIDVATKDTQPIIISKLYPLDNEQILIGTQNNGVVLYNNKDKTIQPLLLSHESPLYVRDIIKKDAHTLWIATESGLYIYNMDDGTLVNLKKSYNNPYSLSDNAIYSLMVDKEDGVWIGTYFGGINYYPKQYTPFKKYFPKLGENSISGNAVREIHADDKNNLWIGTEDGGVNKLNIKQNIFTNYVPSDAKNSISHTNIHGLLIKDNKLLIGTFEHGLDIMDISTGKIVNHFSTTTEGNLSSNFIFAFYENDKNDVFAITTSGIQNFDFKNGIFTPLKGFPQGYFYTSMLEDSEQVLWAGTYWEGLYYYDPKTNTQRVHRHNHNNPQSISSNAINGIFQDSKNRLWITTENGLNEYQPQTNTFQTYSVKEGLPSNVTYSILEDDRNFLWISTSKGLVEFNPESKDLKTYTKANGLLSDQFNYHSAYKAHDGTLYFGSVEGMVSFNPKNFITNEFKPPIYITNVNVDNAEEKLVTPTSKEIASRSKSNEIILTPNESSINLQFAALSFNAPEMTEYWYRLIGLNDDWIYLGRKHEVTFTGLSPGNYKFQLKSRNNNGIWSEESSTLSITVLPPFWKSDLAYALYSIIVLIIAFVILRFYHIRIKEKNKELINELNRQKEKELYNAKIQFFTNISHEIRTPLTLIKSPLEKILKHNNFDPMLKNDLSIMEKNTNRLMELVNQLLDFRKAEVEGAHLTFLETNISELFRHIHVRFSTTITHSNLNLKVDLGNEDVYAYVDSEAMKKIVSNLFSNAIKYAHHDIEISLLQEEENFIMQFKNDGNLIPMHLKDKIFEPFYMIHGMDSPRKSSTGIGLSLASWLVDLHKGILKLEFDDPKMNTFVLQIPIHQAQEINFYKTVPAPEPEAPVQIEDASWHSDEGEKSRIMLVEDNEDLLIFLEKELSTHYHIIKTNSAHRALEILKKENVQLIISDVMMPRKDGFTFCREVKDNLDTSHIPIILLTAKSTLKSKIEGLELGADAYIEKPFSMDHLYAQINNLLQNRAIIIEHYSSSPLAHVKSIAHTKTDEIFIKKLDAAIYANISDVNLNVEKLAELMHMSKSTLYRKIKNLSNLGPNELINITRLKKAAEHLKSGNYKIYEIAELVGYNSNITLLRNFQKQFNMTPSEYMNSNKKV